MATISLTLPVSATVITAGLHSTNYTTIQNAINGGLDTANWGAGKIFAPSKLMQEAAADQNLMVWDNATTIWKAKAISVCGTKAIGMAEVYDRVTSTTDVQNSAAEADIYRKTITGGDLGLSRELRLALQGDYLHNNVAADTIIIRIKYGATTLYQSNAYNLGNVTGANRHGYTLRVYLQNLAATNSQLATAEMLSEVANTGAPTTGIGLLGPTAPITLAVLGIATEDSTANKDLAVTVQWSAASVNNSWRTRGALLELV